MKCLFLDDERFPIDVTWITMDLVKWDIVRSYDDAVAWVEINGFPDIVSFDHDLGDGKTGYDFVKWLTEHDMDTNTMPKNFSFTVHSMNPIGGKNIKELMEGYIKFKNSSI